MIIGIGGCSNSGKSLLASEISEYYKYTKKLKILCQDDFVKRRDFLSKIRDHVDWELPSTIEFDRYLSEVKDCQNTHDIILCEGLFAFWFDELTKLYDGKIFLEIDEKTFKARKRKDLRWGREPEWYIDHIWNSHLKYGQIEKNNPYVLNLNAEKQIDLKESIRFITSLTVKGNI